MAKPELPETQFTPGPWLAEHRKTPGREGYYTEVFTPDDGSGHGTIATLSWYPKPANAIGAIGTYREANSQLIAAAPDMYAALVATREAIERQDGFAELWPLLTAALAKARGEAA